MTFWKGGESYHIIQAMKATGNQPGIIAQWKLAVERWARLTPGNPDAAAVEAWLPLWEVRPFYTAEELAPMWPALAIATGFTDKWPTVVKCAARLANELDFHGLPRLGCEPAFNADLPHRYRHYFIVERLHYWRKATTAEIVQEMENAQR
jgi:hypothetical protein